MDVANGCFAADCGNQKTQTIDVAKKCQISKKVKEEVDGCKCCCLLSHLFGVVTDAALRVPDASWHGDVVNVFLLKSEWACQVGRAGV